MILHASLPPGTPTEVVYRLPSPTVSIEQAAYLVEQEVEVEDGLAEAALDHVPPVLRLRVQRPQPDTAHIQIKSYMSRLKLEASLNKSRIIYSVKDPIGKQEVSTVTS